jgi:predicted nucleotidyltransferase component of viral defense system
MSLQFDKHKNILLRILKDIFTNINISSALGFKGGTAALLFYNLPRHSVDLDFDLLDDSKEKIVFDSIQQIISQYGTITDSYIKRFSLLNILYYAPHTQKIKIEINRRTFGSAYETKSLLGISMQVMVKEDMFAHKLMAMYERIGKTSRDIFDVQFFAKSNWIINYKIVEARSKMPVKILLEKCIKKLQKLKNNQILDGLGELLNEAQKDSTRAKLKDDVIFSLKLMLDLIE